MVWCKLCSEIPEQKGKKPFNQELVAILEFDRIPHKGEYVDLSKINNEFECAFVVTQVMHTPGVRTSCDGSNNDEPYKAVVNVTY